MIEKRNATVKESAGDARAIDSVVDEAVELFSSRPMKTVKIVMREKEKKDE